MNVSVEKTAVYMCQYIKKYREEYQKFIKSSPVGGGYPAFNISPYLNSPELYCYLTNNGVVIADYSWEPEYRWEIAGGPTLLVDLPESRVPSQIVDLLKREGIWGKNIGIYRIVSSDGFDENVWCGKLPKHKNIVKKSIEDTKINVLEFDIDFEELIRRLTFGAFCKILDIHLNDSSSDFWVPHIIRDLGFSTADRRFKKFFHYLELSPHVEKAAWDTRSIKIRVAADVRRDFIHSFGSQGKSGGYLAFGHQDQIQPFFDRLSLLKKTIEDFQKLLNERGNEDESIFHEFLKANPLLMDVYGEPVSKPRFKYPNGESPIGKDYVEPDFIIKYPGNNYKLVELEKPSKRIATVSGQPRSELTQTTFQIAEWKAYIKNHYDLLKEKYPSISINCSHMIVISRSTEENFGHGRDIRRYKELIKEQFSTDEILTYDDLIARAEQAYVALSSLGTDL